MVSFIALLFEINIDILYMILHHFTAMIDLFTKVKLSYTIQYQQSFNIVSRLITYHTILTY